jgi:hypothetical protein
MADLSGSRHLGMERRMMESLRIMSAERDLRLLFMIKMKELGIQKSYQ